MIERKRIAQGKHRSFALVAALLLAATAGMAPRVATADDTVTLSLTLKDHKFDPSELHAPAGNPFDIRVKNLGDIAFEFESSALHFEKIVPPGGEAVVHVRPQQPGRYSFIDDFHHETQGVLIVP
jgi:heme/copper-type cytochrome/quinol oxidase subunit 2